MPEISRINALIKLLDEPDEPAYRKIREQLVIAGRDAKPLLEDALENIFDPLVQERLRSIVRQIDHERLFEEFSEWVNTGAEDLLRGFVLVSKTRYPGLKEDDIVMKIEQLKVDIWIELHENLTALEHVKVMNHVLYQVHHFDGNKDDITAPRNSFVNDLLDSRKGSPLSLGLLYIILAQRLRLPVYGVNLPQHFILAYLTDWGITNPDEHDVLFYINPFNRGAVFTRREIELFTSQMKIQPERSYFVPCTNADIIRRLLNNLLFSYNKLGMSEGVDDIDNLMRAFE